MRCISGFMLVLPAHLSEMKRRVGPTVQVTSRFHIRFARGWSPGISEDDRELEIAVIASGFVAHEAIRSEVLLKKEGIEQRWQICAP
jgi:transketolase C-terminal domain/subunit